MTTRIIEVVGLGQCSLDYIAKVDAYPPPDVKCEFSEMAVHSGGPVATAMVALARWGISSAFAGVIGDDSFGRKIKASLDDEGVDTRGVLIRKGFESQYAFIVAEPGVGRRTIFWRRPTGPPPDPTEIDKKIIRKAKVFHTDGLFPEASIDACKAAREAGVQIVVDAGTLREGMLALAGESDYFLASETFSDALVGKGRALDACRRLADLGPRVVGVTLGAQGYVACAENRVIEQPAYRVEAIDTTGCGDVFHAGFIYGLIKAWDVEKSLDFAAWAAARVSLQLGGRRGIPRLEEWENREV